MCIKLFKKEGKNKIKTDFRNEGALCLLGNMKCSYTFDIFPNGISHVKRIVQ